MVDQEPHRRLVRFLPRLAFPTFLFSKMLNHDPFSVQLLRRVDTRTPTPILSAFIASTAPPPSLGKLADLRALRGSPASSSSQSSWRANPGVTPSPKPPTPGSGTSTPIPSNHRGWTSVVVANPARPVAAPRPMVSLAGTSTSTQLQAGPPPGLGPSGSRTASPAVVVVPVSVSNDPVPDSWEDDT
jgi:transcriptional repressor NF-X1